MATYVLLLRGINLARRRRVAMADLRRLLAEAGCADVRTHLQSGNAVVSAGPDPQALVRTVQQRLGQELGFEVAVLVRTRDELAEVVARSPFPEAEADGARYLVVFLDRRLPAGALADVEPAAYLPDRVHVGERELYLWCPGGIQGSRLPGAVDDRRLGVTTTTRNWNTVTRLLALAGAG